MSTVMKMGKKIVQFVTKKNSGSLMKRKNEAILTLNCNEMKISDAPEPKEILLILKDFDIEKDKLKLKEGSPVITGQSIIPGLLSTVTGTIKSIEPLATAIGEFNVMRIAVSDEEEFYPAIQKEPDFLEADPGEVLKRLNQANLGFCEELTVVETVIVSAVDKEPLAGVYQQIFREEKESIIEGLKLVKHLTSAKRVILAVPEPLSGIISDTTAEGMEVFNVKTIYPNGLPEILLRDISRTYNLDSHIFLGIEKLIAAVKALKEGRPFVYKVVTVIDKKGTGNFRVRIGTPVKDLLKDCDLKDNDKVIIGGPFMGYTCFNTDIPITDDVDSIYIQDGSEVVYYWNNQCMNCGLCVKVCPVYLDVNLLTRYAEFSIFEQCLEMRVNDCIECGLCAYKCPSGRSLVQFIQLAKNEVRKIEEEISKNGEIVS